MVPQLVFALELFLANLTVELGDVRFLFEVLGFVLGFILIGILLILFFVILFDLSESFLLKFLLDYFHLLLLFLFFLLPL